MGKLVDNEVFLQQLNLMYAGTKKWGTVRIIIKRCKFSIGLITIVYEEQNKHKETKRKEQVKYEKDLSADKKHEFDIVVRAANPKRKLSTVVRFTMHKST